MKRFLTLKMIVSRRAAAGKQAERERERKIVSSPNRLIITAIVYVFNAFNCNEFYEPQD
jgi:hydrogenase-4 membrane subunit HyfE